LRCSCVRRLKEGQERAFDVVGPLPPDTVFYHTVKGAEIGRSQLDAVVAMYHDQEHIPIERLGLLEGISVILGLPIIPTSVDHGTAFGKAGKGTADPTNLVQAIRLAVRMAA
jgi:4-hydroxy-L-threonine phosphate dehydrogenase PdxA